MKVKIQFGGYLLNKTQNYSWLIMAVIAQKKREKKYLSSCCRMKMFVSGVQKDLYIAPGVAKENGISNMQHKAISHFAQENLFTCLGGTRGGQKGRNKTERKSTFTRSSP